MKVLKKAHDIITKRLETVKSEKIPTYPKTMMLLVSEYCNMRCLYCYGSYGSKVKPKLMNEKTLKLAIDFAVRIGIRKVGLFGGEPLLNFDLIKKAVEYGKGKDMEFGITTNGTIVTDEIADFCKEHNIKVSVSIDGPKEVHDLCRVYPDGRGTYDDVIRGIKKLSERGILSALEMTYSAKHPEDLKMIIDALAPFSKLITCACVDGPRNAPYKDLIIRGDRLRKYYQTLSTIELDGNLKSGAVRVGGVTELMVRLLSPIKYINPIICSGLADRVMVSSDGDMYPCPETMKKEYCLGNIGDENSIKNFGGNRKRILSMFSRERLLPYWFANIADICVVRMEKSRDGKLAISDLSGISESFEDLIYKITEIDKTQLVGALKDRLPPLRQDFIRKDLVDC